MGYLGGVARMAAIGLALAVALALLWGLHTSPPEPAPPAPAPQALPEAPPAAQPPIAATPPAKPAAPVERWVRVEAAEPAETQVPIEKLLHWDESRPAPRGLDLASQPAGTPEVAPRAGTGLGKRVYLQRRTDEAGPGDRQRKLETTDVGVRVPVAPSVELRGGMRLESRHDGDAEASTTEPTPTVGVGVNF